MNSKAMFSKNSDNWSTPIDFYNKLNVIYNFDFDPCPLNYQYDSLIVPWGCCNFVNPPYSRIKDFLIKAITEYKQYHKKSIFLVPSRTDTKWFHDLIYKKYPIEFIKGRLKFGNSKNSAPFPSMLIYIGFQK